ncbi:efflux RND transporter periplasmic adaptor subunit [Rhodoligotrophos defluvii]|uniref:efflux RND transporter periplasmic adaptor subunit n=1 Tax=Rhodoligotrophos defluvii TaxID=2561934 RepID=UPI0010C97418|nr:efflux RND transporter periplasmic adaptor subunit [Rhodoligotrophos defluvii]
MIKRFLIVSVLVIAVVGGIGYYKLVFEPELVRNIIMSSPMPTATVSAEAAKEQSWQQRISAIGTVRATRGIEVTSEVAGRITIANFESGQDVKAGAELIQLDDSTEQAQLKSDLATLKSAQLTYERQLQLFKSRTTSQANLDDALAARDQAAAAVELTRAQIAKKRITVPFDGRLGIRLVDVGQYVTPGTPFVGLHTLDPIYVDFPIPEQQTASLRNGLTVEVRTDAFPGETFTGKIEALDSRINPETRAILVRASLPNPDKRLLPGMFANVDVIAGEQQMVVTVPATAVTYSLYGDTVFVLTPQDGNQGKNGSAVSQNKSGGVIESAQAQEADKGGQENQSQQQQLYKVERRVVKTGAQIGDRVQIVEGLKAGELVATSGQNKLQGGMTARVDNTNPLVPPETPPKG